MSASLGLRLTARIHDVEVSLNYCSQNGGNLYRAPYYNRNLNIGPRSNSKLPIPMCGKERLMLLAGQVMVMRMSIFGSFSKRGGPRDPKG